MEIGSIWNGWKVDKILGEGSFGKVYRIVREEFGHTYESALKVIEIPQNYGEVETIKSEGLNDESVTEYFQSMVEDIVDEFALMSRLKGNTNIVSYEDHFVIPLQDRFGWRIYIRMELLTPLYDYMKKHIFSIRDVIKLGIDLCQALEVCQKYNIIHRDIKPENIFVSELGNFKLGDFGIARQLEKTLSALSKKGTYTYMAPEVYKGMPYNSTVDIYSLGIVLYRFLNNNRTPFLPPYPQKMMFSDREKANVLRISGESIPKPCNAEGRLSEIVLKACAYHPNERYESASDMKRALQEILYSEYEAKLIYPDGDDLGNTDFSFSVSNNIPLQNYVEQNDEKTVALYDFNGINKNEKENFHNDELKKTESILMNIKSEKITEVESKVDFEIVADKLNMEDSVKAIHIEESDKKIDSTDREKQFYSQSTFKDNEITREYCSNCGALVSRSQHYCNVCFKPIKKERRTLDSNHQVEKNKKTITRQQLSDPQKQTNKVDLNTKYCPVCGSIIQNNARRCMQCGTKISVDSFKENSQHENKKRYCKQCGCLLNTASHYCLSCGSKIK